MIRLFFFFFYLKKYFAYTFFLLYKVACISHEIARENAWEDLTCFTASQPSSSVPPSSAITGSFGTIAERCVYDGSQILFMSLELR